jgi:hypothetical protein
VLRAPDYLQRETGRPVVEVVLHAAHVCSANPPLECLDLEAEWLCKELGLLDSMGGR